MNRFEEFIRERRYLRNVYLRRGGSVFHLQKVLGHSSLEVTRRYANLVIADLQAMHERVSLLSN
jgi:integrase/recombinase XerD